MVFHGTSIIAHTILTADFQRRTASGKKAEAQFDRSNVSDALFPRRCRQRARMRCDAMRCDAQRPFCWRVRRKCDVIYREIAFDSAAGTSAGTNSQAEARSARRAARGLVARSKNHSRILPLTFLRSARSRRGYARARARMPKENNLDCLLSAAADDVPPSDFVCRHARAPRSLRAEGSVFQSH